MRIGVMLRHLEQQEGGVKVYTKNVLPRLLTLGAHHTFVLLYQDRKLLGTYAQYHNVEEMAVSFPGTVAWDQIGVPLAARGRRLDLIFNPKLTVPLLTTSKTVLMVHGSEALVIPEHFGRFDIWYRKIFRPLYLRSAAACIAVSNTVKADLVRCAAAEPGKVFPIYNGIDPELFRPVKDLARLSRLREKYQLPDHFILWAGQIESRKNVARLLQAFAQIMHEIPHSLVIAGERRRSSAHELHNIEELGLAGRVHFPGWISQTDLPAIYCLADVFAFPSLYEGFGIPLIEAMACGCPIVAANTGTPPEILNGAGYLVDPLNVNDIASGIRTVLSEAGLRQGMIAKGIEQAKGFSWDQTARQLLAVLEQAGGRGAGVG
jgi:glycosyltransferase involved in cell wall biosynthesis